MATDLPTRADVLRRAAYLLMTHPTVTDSAANAMGADGLLRALEGRTANALALLQLHDRLPADPPAAVPVVEPVVDPVDPWAPVMTTIGVEAKWARVGGVATLYATNAIGDEHYIFARILGDGSWVAKPPPSLAWQRDEEHGAAPSLREALPHVLAALRELGTVPPLPTKED